MIVTSLNCSFQVVTDFFSKNVRSNYIKVESFAASLGLATADGLSAENDGATWCFSSVKRPGKK